MVKDLAQDVSQGTFGGSFRRFRPPSDHRFTTSSPLAATLTGGREHGIIDARDVPASDGSSVGRAGPSLKEKFTRLHRAPATSPRGEPVVQYDDVVILLMVAQLVATLVVAFRT